MSQVNTDEMMNEHKTPLSRRMMRIFPEVVKNSKDLQPSQNNNVNATQTYSFETSVFGDSKNHKQDQIKNGTDHIYDSLDDKTSPGLLRLRMTPGIMKEKQRNLIEQHDEIRQKGSHLKSGGGISLWPEMRQMRLTKSEVLWLLVQAVMLCCLTIVLLNKLHGETFWSLHKFKIQVKQFCQEKSLIKETVDEERFKSEVTQWHNEFLRIISNIQEHFDISSMSASFQIYILTYCLGIFILLFYLMDNMLAKNKLTPSRIKKWTCLLVVIGSWTCMMAYGLFLAYQLEKQMISCIQQYSSSLASLATTSMNLDIFQAVLLYWRSRFLDNTSHGLVSVFGVIPVRDLIYYLQYYSVPIGTVLLSPVLQLLCACLAVYSQGEYVRTEI